jgi:hypothetical protein
MIDGKNSDNWRYWFSEPDFTNVCYKNFTEAYAWVILRWARTSISFRLHNPQLEVMWHEITFSPYPEVDWIINLASQAISVRYHRDQMQKTG